MAEELRMQIQHTNMQVVNCSTPANYFHVLRRQVHRAFRKPLVIATPKSLLRHKSAVSKLADMADGSTFARVIPDLSAAGSSPTSAKKVRKLLFCTGKVYYDLEKHRHDTGATDVAIARVEQIAPFPFDLVAQEIKRFPNASVTWVQEEPRNMGAWSYVWPRIMTATRVLLSKEINPVCVPTFMIAAVALSCATNLMLIVCLQAYVGRLAAASPAAGSTKIHDAEVSKLLADSFA
jgi:2-oxoglutarate dehydrogenase E1 component